MKYAIETNNLSKQYHSYQAVSKVDLHVPEGKIYGLLGRNGAGKTTIMKLLLGLITPDDGTIELLGERVHGKENKILSTVGSMIETPGFYDNLTARENLMILQRLRGKKDYLPIDSVLQVVNLDKELRKPFMDYSLGMKQRLGIAAAIIHEPKLLILDEPINGLDPIGIAQIRRFLVQLCKEKGITILISSHVLSEIDQIADTIGIMQMGTLIKEVDMQKLHDQNRGQVSFLVSDSHKAYDIVRKQMGSVQCHISRNRILFRDFTGSTSQVNEMFVKNGIGVSEITVGKESLEEYFAGLIGGEEIA